MWAGARQGAGTGDSWRFLFGSVVCSLWRGAFLSVHVCVSTMCVCVCCVSRDLVPLVSAVTPPPPSVRCLHSGQSRAPAAGQDASACGRAERPPTFPDAATWKWALETQKPRLCRASPGPSLGSCEALVEVATQCL